MRYKAALSRWGEARLISGEKMGVARQVIRFNEGEEGLGSGRWEMYY